MGLLIGVVSALLVPFLLFLEWNVFIWLGTSKGSAIFLCVITGLIGFTTVMLDTSGLERKSTLRRWLESQRGKEV